MTDLQIQTIVQAIADNSVQLQAALSAQIAHAANMVVGFLAACILAVTWKG